MLTKVIFFTLIHSLWIGLLAAILCGIVLVCTKKTAPNIRYNLLSAGLILFTLLTAGAGIYEYNAAATILNSGEMPHYFKDMTAIIPSFIETEKNSLFENLVLGFSAWKEGLLGYAYPILWIWSIVLCFKLILLLRSVQYVNKLKKSGLMPLQEDLTIKSISLTKQYNIPLPVRLYYSSIAAVPQVVGWLKPIVLIPIGLINRLSPEQVEAVIAHELAHIKRRDYMINCLQYMLEIFFFFNPFLLWLSNKIKEEREHCCDDLVMLTNFKKTDYINALIVCSEYSSYTPVQSLALIKGKNQLLKRVTRLLTNQNLTFNNMEKIILIFLSVFMISFVSVYGTKIKELPVIEYLNDKISAFQSDTIKPKVEQKIRIEKNTITTNEKGEKTEKKIVLDTLIVLDDDQMDNGFFGSGGNSIFMNDDNIIFKDLKIDGDLFNGKGFKWKEFQQLDQLNELNQLGKMKKLKRLDDLNELERLGDLKFYGYQNEGDHLAYDFRMSEKDRMQIENQIKDVTIYIKENGKEIARHFNDYRVEIPQLMKEQMKAQKEELKHQKEYNKRNINANKQDPKRYAEEARRLAEETKRYAERVSMSYGKNINIVADTIEIWDPESRQSSFVITKQEQALSPRNSRFNGRNEVSNNPKNEAIRTQLILDQIVTAYSLETIELNDKLFMVNGVIQSNKIHKKYKKMFLDKDASSLKARF